MEKINNIIEEIKSLTILELSELVKAVEAEFAALAENNKMDVARVKEFIAAEDMKGDMLVQKALEVVKSTAKAAKKPAAKKAAKKDEE